MKISEVPPLAIKWHSIFSKTVWGSIRPSFHNKYHIQAVEKAAQVLFNNISQDDDPMEIKENMKLWNQIFPNRKVSFSDLNIIFIIALACHDLGNICERIEFDNSMSPIPVFLPGYKSKEAEKRGQQISKALLSITDLREGEKNTYIDLTQYLIGETVFSPNDLKRPFSQLTRVVDQIGSRLFSRVEKEKMERGLLEEMAYENPDIPLYNPDYFFNFPRKRIYELGLDEPKIDKLLSSWNRHLPEKTLGYKDAPINIKDAIIVFEKNLKCQSIDNKKRKIIQKFKRPFG